MYQEQCNITKRLSPHFNEETVWPGDFPIFLLTSTKRAQFSLSSPSPSRFQVDSLIEHGARQFVFLTVPPTNRAPLLIDQGPQVVSSITAALADYNKQLVANVKSLPLRHRGVTASIFDTRPIFNTLLDNADTFGFVNATGFCEAYQNGTPDINTQIPPCAPVSSYL